MLASTNHLLGAAIGALIAASTLTTVAAATNPGPRYDGVWSVSIVTEKGDCDRGYRYPIRISNGVLGNGGSDPFTISGKVAPSGAITVTVSSGSKSAIGSGRLAGDSGEGLWHGGACSGTWTAERRSS
jgi:hypothetical protein